MIAKFVLTSSNIRHWPFVGMKLFDLVSPLLVSESLCLHNVFFFLPHVYTFYKVGMYLQLRLVDCLFVESGKDVFPHGSNKSAIFGSENFSTPVLFLLLVGAIWSLNLS